MFGTPDVELSFYATNFGPDEFSDGKICLNVTTSDASHHSGSSKIAPTNITARQTPGKQCADTSGHATTGDQQFDVWCACLPPDSHSWNLWLPNGMYQASASLVHTNSATPVASRYGSSLVSFTVLHEAQSKVLQHPGASHKLPLSNARPMMNVVHTTPITSQP